MDNKLKQIMVVLLFFAGVCLYIIAIMSTTNSTLFTLQDDLQTSRALEMVGNLCLAASIIGATQLKEK